MATLESELPDRRDATAFPRHRLLAPAAIALCVLLSLTACTRTHYRIRADRDAYSILGEKADCTAWMPPPGFTIEPDPRSRFFDPTPIDDPILPVPAPRLYAYELPTLPARDPNRFFADQSVPGQFVSNDKLLRRLAPVEEEIDRAQTVALVDFEEPAAADAGEVQTDAPRNIDDMDATAFEEAEDELRIVEIPQTVWDSIPTSCLIRMFEFQSVRDEYIRTYGTEPSSSQRDTSQKLALEDIVDLALINSRQYQTQKEVLYRAALRLTLDRYDYQLKFSTSGNGTAADFTHDRTGGITENNLRVPSSIQADKVLATAGDLVARFANSVVLTFNGPDGFAADVGSELLLDISQSVFQRDVVFESLTQAERDVVYAARDFARFRKEFFANLAFSYYNQILSFRAIEIATQDYFSNLRGFLQAEAEYQAGRFPRFEVDQFEQQALTSRSSLITSCNQLERGLDQLKLLIGLPIELPINLDLTELDQLTARDETMASAELVQRAVRNLTKELQRQPPVHSNLLNATIQLIGRIIDLSDSRERLGIGALDTSSLILFRATMYVEEARDLVTQNRVTLEDEKSEEQPNQLQILPRTIELADSVLNQASLQLRLAELLQLEDPLLPVLRSQVPQLRSRLDQLQESARVEIVENLDFARIPEFIQRAEALLAEAEPLVQRADELLGTSGLTEEDRLRRTLREIDPLLQASDVILQDDVGGLVPIEIDMDDAMLTALSRRFDLMNQRGILADTWRRIKLAGDDLRSVLNLNATQFVNTRADVNRGFDFTWDESQTQLSMTLDTPLNRRSQRNSFRISLINYNAALRQLIQLEDQVKLDIRDSLRNLQVDREQYFIAVANAALAYERVISTQLYLRESLENITARDVLEAQQAYTASLNAVASRHITYVQDRIQLFLDLEALQVDGQGFWPQLYNERFQPEPNFVMPLAGRPVYGELPPWLWYSHKLKRMLDVPAGYAEIHRQEANDADQQPPPLEPIPAPPPAD